MIRPLATALLTALMLPSLAQQAPTVDLLGHRALYELSLDRARGEIAGVRGTMAFEILDACDGWTVRQRLTLIVSTRDGQEVESISDYATWESRDGRQLRFRMRQTTDGADGERTAGEAVLTAEGGSARYTQPDTNALDLARGTLFPTAHTIAAIEAARRGQRILAVPLMDGTSAEGPQDSSTAIATSLPPGQHPHAELAQRASWRMRIAFFARDGSGQPEYEVGLRYFDNGVADELQMDFGDFVLNGRMTQFTAVPARC